MQNAVCIIPLRSKSKGIKNKNIKKILGIPLCIYVISAAIKSKIFAKIFLACDSFYYFKVIKKYLNKTHLDQNNIIFFKRSKKSSSDFVKTEMVINEVLKKNKNFDYCYLLQATSPLLLKNDIIKSYRVLLSKNLDSLFSVYRTHKFLWSQNRNIFNSVNYNYKNRPMRQKKKPDFIETGALYAFKIKKFIQFKNRLFGKIGVLEIPYERSIDIDGLNDFKNAKKFIVNNLKKYKFIKLN